MANSKNWDAVSLQEHINYAAAASSPKVVGGGFTGAPTKLTTVRKKFGKK